MLTVRDLHAFYGKSHILSGVSRYVRGHEIVALLGRNGAGKSTLLKTLIGIAPPERGSIRLAGEETARLDAASDPAPADYPYGGPGVEQRSRVLAA